MSQSPLRLSELLGLLDTCFPVTLPILPVAIPMQAPLKPEIRTRHRNPKMADNREHQLVSASGREGHSTQVPLACAIAWLESTNQKSIRLT